MGCWKVELNMNDYKYFENAEKNAYFTDEPCQFCGSQQNCLDGAFFERDDIQSVCLNCFDSKKIYVNIPDYIKKKVSENKEEKFAALKFCPPVPWIQNDEHPVCCDDYMTFIGEWEQEDFCNNSNDGDGLKLLKELLSDDLHDRVENFNVLFDDLGYESAAFVFRCSCCGKIIVICQDY